MAATLEEFLEEHKHELKVLESGKIKCLVTNHECHARLTVLQDHWKGKQYRRAKAKEALRPIDINDYYPHIMKHKRLPNMVYCRLTKRELVDDKAAVLAHVSGRKFKFALACYIPRKSEEDWELPPEFDDDLEEELVVGGVEEEEGKGDGGDGVEAAPTPNTGQRRPKGKVKAKVSKAKKLSPPVDGAAAAAGVSPKAKVTGKEIKGEGKKSGKAKKAGVKGKKRVVGEDAKTTKKLSTKKSKPSRPVAKRQKRK